MNSLWSANGWWIQRMLLVPVHLFAFAIVVFFLVRLIPGDPVLVVAGPDQLSQEQYEEIQAALGLSGPLWQQLVTYLGRLATGDLGRSPIDNMNVLDQMMIRLPATLELALLAMTFAILLTIVLTIFCMLRPNNVLARGLGVYARSAGAIPDFVLGVASILLFYAVLRWAPAPIGRYQPGLLPPPRITGFPLLDALLTADWILVRSMVNHLWLPVLVLVVGSVPTIMKVLLRSVQRATADEATLFRIASGAPQTMVLVSIIRRAMPNMVTMCGQLFGYLVGGAVIIEQLFAIPGIGQYGIQAVSRSDFVALQGFLLTVAASVLVVFFVVDVVNMLLDPRRRPGVRTKGA